MLKITDQLTFKEIALLYSAMLFYKENSEAAFADTLMNNGTPLHKEVCRAIS